MNRFRDTPRINARLTALGFKAYTCLICITEKNGVKTETNLGCLVWGWKNNGDGTLTEEPARLICPNKKGFPSGGFEKAEELWRKKNGNQ